MKFEFKEISGGFFTRLKYIKQKISIHNNAPVNVRQKSIIKDIHEDKYITQVKLAEKYSVNRGTIKRDLQKLKELNIIKRIGSAKAGYWRSWSKIWMLNIEYMIKNGSFSCDVKHNKLKANNIYGRRYCYSLVSAFEVYKKLRINSKINEMQAALGILQLKTHKQNVNKRKEILEIYRRELNEVDGISLLTENTDVQDNNYSYFPAFIDEKKYRKNSDELYYLLKENDIFVRRYFYPLISNLFNCFS